MTKEEVAALKESLKADYEKNIEAIERVARLLSERKGAPIERSTDDVQDAATLKAAVEAVVHNFGSNKWNVNEVLDRLKVAEYAFEGKDPYKSLHSTIWKLEKQGIVRVVVRGKGRRPNTYQTVAHKSDEADAALNGRH